MKKIIRIALMLSIVIVCLVLSACGEHYTLEKAADPENATKGYFGKEHSSVSYDLSTYITTNADDVIFDATSSDESVAEVGIDNKTLTVTLKKGDGEALINITATSEKAKNSVSLSFTVRAEQYSKIACIGDSLTYGHTWHDESYPVYLAEYLGKDVEVRNFGVNGASVTGSLDKNPRYFGSDMYSQSIAYDADIVIILLGTNDSKAWEDAEPVFQEQYEALIAVYRKINPDVRIIAVTSPPVMENNKFSTPGEVIENEVVPLQKQIAEENDLTLLDFNAVFLTDPDVLNEFLRGDAAFDGIHLSVQGAECLAELLSEIIYSF